MKIYKYFKNLHTNLDKVKVAGNSIVTVKFEPTDSTNYETPSAKTINYVVEESLVKYTIKYKLKDAEGDNDTETGSYSGTAKIGTDISYGNICNFIGSIPCENVSKTPYKAQKTVGVDLPGTTKLTLERNASNNVITYYYDRTCYGTTCDFCAMGSKIGNCLYDNRDKLKLYESGIGNDVNHQTARFTNDANGNQPNNYICFGVSNVNDCLTRTYKYKYGKTNHEHYGVNYKNELTFNQWGKQYLVFWGTEWLLPNTISIRIKFNDVWGRQEFFGNWESAGMGLDLIDNVLNFKIYNRDWKGYVNLAADYGAIQPNVWYTITGVYDPNNSLMKLYINGELVNSLSISINEKWIGAPFAIGANPKDNDGTLDGNYANATVQSAIADFDVLTDDEVKQYLSGEITDYPNSDTTFIDPKVIQSHIDNDPHYYDYGHRIISTMKQDVEIAPDISELTNDHQIRVIYPQVAGSSKWDDDTFMYYHTGSWVDKSANAFNFWGGYNQYLLGKSSLTWMDLIADSWFGMTASSKINDKTAENYLSYEMYTSNQHFQRKFVVTQLSDLLLSTGDSSLNYRKNYDKIKLSWMWMGGEWTVHRLNTAHGWLIGQNGLCSNDNVNSTVKCTGNESAHWNANNNYRVTFNLKETTLYCGGSGKPNYPYLVNSGNCT